MEYTHTHTAVMCAHILLPRCYVMQFSSCNDFGIGISTYWSRQRSLQMFGVSYVYVARCYIMLPFEKLKLF